jgi:hypothetical protein
MTNGRAVMLQVQVQIFARVYGRDACMQPTVTADNFAFEN